MELRALKVDPRQSAGSAAARRLRREGKVPSVLYGHGGEVVALSVSAEDMRRVLETGHHLVKLDLGGREESALVKEVQFDTWEKKILHVDFGRVALHETVTVSVEVVSHGTPKSVLAGGVLEQPLHSVELECRADAIPDQIRVEVGELETGDMIHVRDLPLPSGVKALSEPEAIVFVVHEARIVEEAPEAEPVKETAEPEVIGRAAKPEEEASDEEKS